MRSHAKHPAGRLARWRLSHERRVLPRRCPHRLSGKAPCPTAGPPASRSRALRSASAPQTPGLPSSPPPPFPAPPPSRGSRARSTCRQARARPRPWEPGSRRSARPPASRQPRAAASGAYSTLHFAEGADAQRVAQHVVSDLHAPVVLLLLSHVRRAQPRSAAGSSVRVRVRPLPPLPPRALQCGRRLPTVQRARGGGGAGGGGPRRRGARGRLGARAVAWGRPGASGGLGGCGPGGAAEGTRSAGGHQVCGGGAAKGPPLHLRGRRARGGLRGQL